MMGKVERGYSKLKEYEEHSSKTLIIECVDD